MQCVSCFLLGFFFLLRQHHSTLSVQTEWSNASWTQCYGALGGTVDIQLMDNTSEINRYQLLKSSLKILDVRKNTVISNTIRERAHFPSNGTFRINKLNRTDSGNYSLQTFDSDGKSSDERILQLFIEGKCLLETLKN
uniref:Immunoglobulin V-set domain-containing protein n=1 Tax=Maylandia zebra TaxID=106582 RepID=A0A3P9C5F9_9CICH